MPRAKRRTELPGRGGKNTTIQLRISEEDKQTLAQMAAREGLDLSTWLRQLALRAAGKLPPSQG
jgi:hypothetical protein